MPLFEYLRCFEVEIYYLILISIIVMSLMISLKKKSIKAFFVNVWQYLSVIISEYFSIKPIDRFECSLGAIWLLSCIVLIALYSGHLWDLLVRPQAIDKIDSWDDLYTKPQWNKLNIRTPYFLDMADFALNDESEMAQNFKKRMIFINPFKALFDQNIIRTALEEVFSGNEVLAVDTLIVHYYKFSDKFNLFKQFNEGFDYHISENGAGLKPYFITICKSLNESLTNHFNHM